MRLFGVGGILFGACLMGGLGSLYLLHPDAVRSSAAISPETPSALAEIQSTYGGLHVGIALFLLACAARENTRPAGLLFCGLAFAGAGVAGRPPPNKPLHLPAAGSGSSIRFRHSGHGSLRARPQASGHSLGRRTRNRSVARSLAAIAALIFILMGAVHGGLTLRDVFHPKSFTPTDPRVREAMQGARLAFNPRANVWRAWLGFNLSHSLGLLVFGAVVLAFGWRHFELFAASFLAQAFLLLVAASYFVLSVRFWFWGPAVGSGVAFACLLAAVFLC